MAKASDVIGRRVTAREGGQSVGRLKDLAVDETGREILAIVLSEGVLSSSRVAPWPAVQAFGPDSVIIDSAASVVKASTMPDIQTVMAKKTTIKGLRLLTTTGKELGEIVDFVFDETTGEVIGYELSSHLFVDDFDGTPFLPTPQWIELGKDVAFVSPDVESTIGPSGGTRAMPEEAAPAPGNEVEAT